MSEYKVIKLGVLLVVCSFVVVAFFGMMLATEYNTTSKTWMDDFDDGNISDWEVHTSGTGIYEISDTEAFSNPNSLHMKFSYPNHAYGWSPQIEDWDVTENYHISLRFMLPHTNNHWFSVICDGRVSLNIDQGSELIYYRWPGGPTYRLTYLSTGDWHLLELIAYPDARTFNVKVDGTEFGPYPFSEADFNNKLRIGSSATPASTNRGEGYWDDLELTYTPSPPTKTWMDDFDDGDISDWYIDVDGIGNKVETSSAYCVSPPYALHVDASYAPGKAFARSPAISDWDTSKDYNVSTGFYLPTSNNHWFKVLVSNEICLLIDYNTDLIAYRWWDDRIWYITTLNTNQWYTIECKVDMTALDYDVFIDGEYRGNYPKTGPWEGNNLKIFGDDSGSNTWGKAYWDDVKVTYTTPSSSIKIWMDDFDDGDISDWFIHSEGIGNKVETSSAYCVSPPYALHVDASYAPGKARVTSPSIPDWDISKDYTVSTEFYLPTSNNHWFKVLVGNEVGLIIDYNTELIAYRWYDNTIRHVAYLNTDQWYTIECKVHMATLDYDVYIDGEYKGTYPKIGPAENKNIWFGDDAGSATWGEAYWDDIKITYVPLSANPDISVSKEFVPSEIESIRESPITARITVLNIGNVEITSMTIGDEFVKHMAANSSGEVIVTISSDTDETYLILPEYLDIILTDSDITISFELPLWAMPFVWKNGILQLGGEPYYLESIQKGWTVDIVYLLHPTEVLESGMYCANATVTAYSETLASVTKIAIAVLTVHEPIQVTDDQ